ncbi:GNAT family N-acetyltransferase [Porifericola rhodea]|uniref:GNAT family N-acetyltransferase n=1 Tax=Porifericola rhodea TaxID=930972 RepID=UPI0026671F7E|nr:GNAT family N-acetyltransferase [Porifericola rhodea]WKN30925.1 GNAT family N-acetyltransferase [Porifericola rhodea]
MIPTQSDLRFTLDRKAITPKEQMLFNTFLYDKQWDETVWLILNGILRTSTLYTIPKILRAYYDNLLVGVAYIIECKKPALSFFNNPLASLVNAPQIPMYLWTRNGIMVDSNTNTGFVSEEIDLYSFYQQAIAYLNRRYLYGLVLESSKERPATDYTFSPLCDCGCLKVDAYTPVELVLAKHKNLRKKKRKFENKGGKISSINGALDQETLNKAIHYLSTLRLQIQTPYQDNYVNMARQSSSYEHDNIVHFIASLEGEMVGYHSFVRCQNSMHCLSGAFDRGRKSNYHAYENMILESMRYAHQNNIHTIHYGPILNPTKASLMDTTEDWEMRFYSRFATLRNALKMITPYSKLKPETFTPFRKKPTVVEEEVM